MLKTIDSRSFAQAEKEAQKLKSIINEIQITMNEKEATNNEFRSRVITVNYATPTFL